MWRHELQGRYAGHGRRRQPLDGGSTGLRAGTRGFPAGVEAAGFTSPYPPVMPQDDRGRCDRHPSVDPGGVAHGHHGCLWATLPGSISAWSSIPWSLRFAEMTRGYRAMKPPASTPAQPATGIYLYPMNRFGVKKRSRPSAYTSRHRPILNTEGSTSRPTLPHIT